MLGGLYEGKPKLIIEDKFHKWRESYIKNKNSCCGTLFLRQHVYPFLKQ